MVQVSKVSETDFQMHQSLDIASAVGTWVLIAFVVISLGVALSTSVYSKYVKYKKNSRKKKF